jgi:hypothetical protein
MARVSGAGEKKQFRFILGPPGDWNTRALKPPPSSQAGIRGSVIQYGSYRYVKPT